MGKIGLLVFSFVALMSMLIAGCSAAKEKAEEKVQEKIAEKAIGGDVDISSDGIKIEKDGNTYQSGEDLTWQEDKMGGLPEPKAKINTFMDTGMGSFVGFEEMSEDDARAYIQKLAELGYAENALNAEDGGTISYTASNSEGASVAFSYTVSSKDGTITYIKAGTEVN